MLNLLIKQSLDGLIVPPALPPLNAPPVWDIQPAPIFIIGGGVQTFDMNDISSDLDMDTITFTLNTGAASLDPRITWTAATGILAYDGTGTNQATTTGHISTLDDGTDTTDSDSFPINIINLYPNQFNGWGGSILGSASRAMSEFDEEYLLCRTMNVLIYSLNNLTDSDERSIRAADIQSLGADNPQIIIPLHDAHFTNRPAYERKTRVFGTFLYKYCNTNTRADAILFIDVDDDGTEINGNVNPPSGGSQSGFTARIVDSGVRAWQSDAMHDLITGTNTASSPSLPTLTGDLSGICINYNDSTQLVNPNFNSQLMNPFSNGIGNVVSIDSVVSTQLRTITIDTRPTAGSGVVDNVTLLFKGTTGFIGYRIATYTEVGGSDAQLTFDPLPSNADGVSQDTVPDDTYKYCINNSGSDTTTVDWNADGTPTSIVPSSNQWVPSMLAYFDAMDTKINGTTGEGSGRACNAISTSFQSKEDNGWEVPHAYNDSLDLPGAENYSTKSKFQADPDSGPHQYDCSNTNINRWLRAVNFAKTFVRSTPNSFMSDKARGAILEILAWGDDYSDVNAIDANFLRFFLAINCIFNEKDLLTAGMFEGTGNTPLTVEEAWLDLDTGRRTVTSIGTYNEDSGSSGSQGPFHEFILATPSAGEAIMIRRLTDDIGVAVNLDDAFSGYDIYDPSHDPLSTGGGVTPRSPQDEITTSDWAALIGTELAGGETIEKIDFSTYINSRVTDWNRGKNPSHWNSFDVGSEQTHPNDSDGTYAIPTHPGIARDPVMNDGSSIDLGATTSLAPLESFFFKVNP